MDIQTFREYCLAKKGVSEDLPFDEATLAFRVMGKIFALTNTEKLPFSINLKCGPERAIDLRERYEGIIPGYHMNKKHWNTVIPEQGVSDELVLELTDHSYELVRKSLKKADKAKLIEL